MSTTQVLRLDAYRGRRQQRVQRALILLGPDAARLRLGELVAEALQVAEGDRAAVVWIDEFGSLVPRPHVVIDLVTDPPRRAYDSRLLQQAWGIGVPGVVDVPDALRGRGQGEAPRSSLCVCLGSDGLRTWFLVVDSLTGRGPLEPEVRDRLMHLAGRCTTVLLNRELLGERGGPGRADAFTGWSVLSDVDYEDAVEDRITERFLVLRLVRACLDDDLSPDPGLISQRVEALRAELGGGEERPRWEAVLGAAEVGDMPALARAVLQVGLRSEDVGEIEGALEAFRSGYWVAALSVESSAALEAARYLGRSLRRAGRWDDSERWYSQAVVLARAIGDASGEALALDGQAATLRARGNLPGARRVLDEALEAAHRSGDAHAVGSVHQQIMTAHHLAGRGDEAIEHGWASVRAFRSLRDQLRALVSLAGILLDLGAVELAEEAYEVALERVEEGYYRAFALEGHAHAAALRGDREAYECRYETVLDEAWAAGGVDFQAQARLYRGRAYRALGDLDEARRWFDEALAFAEKAGLHAYVFQAEEALRALEHGDAEPTREPAPHPFAPDTLDEVRGGLGALRREFAGVGA
jgi:tetratricopeptide (TPR) repeat protein